MVITHLSDGFASAARHTWFSAYIKSLIGTLVANGVEVSSSGSAGGYFSIFEPHLLNPPRLEEIIRCGSFPKEKTERYFYLSMEKAFRLNDYITKGHLTSADSADAEEDEFAGAVYIKSLNRIFSFSGLNPVYVDECMAVFGAALYCSLGVPKNYPHLVTLQDVPEFFSRNRSLIDAPGSSLEIMMGSVLMVIEEEMKMGRIKR